MSEKFTLQIDRQILRSSLRSIKKVVSGDDELELDLNLLATSDESIKLYVRRFSDLQILYEFTDGPGVNVAVEDPWKLVFSSEVLVDVINKASSDRIQLSFTRDRLDIQFRQDWFSEPTSVNIPVFRESEFQPPISRDDFKKVGEVGTEPLVDNLKVMETISPEVEFELEDGNFRVKASDIVQGEAKAIKKFDSSPTVSTFSYLYAIKPIRYFLSSIDADTAIMYVAPDGSLKLSTDEPEKRSEMLLGKRIRTS